MTNRDDKSIYINGRFLSQKLTGVQRYCRQVVLAIDKALQEETSHWPLRDVNWYLLAPPGTVCDLDLAVIRFKEIGKKSGHIWEQVYLLQYARKGRLLSMGNSGPVLHPRQVVVIHDAAVYFAPAGFAWQYRLLHSVLGRCLAHSARIATVSAFSRSELARALGLSSGDILLAPNGTDHFQSFHRQTAILDRLGLVSGKYFVSLGLSTANKNVALAFAAFRLLNRVGTKLVIVGEGSARVAGFQTLPEGAGIVIAGRLSDEDLAGLMRRAAAFVFPSKYEGFGIPLLEAMAQGCPVLASTAAAVVEVCGGAALHFEPDDAGQLAGLMQRILDDPEISTELRTKGYRRQGQYRWAAASSVLLNGMHSLGCKI